MTLLPATFGAAFATGASGIAEYRGVCDLNHKTGVKIPNSFCSCSCSRGTPIRDCFLGFVANFFSSDSARLVALFSYRLCFSFAVHLEHYPAMEWADRTVKGNYSNDSTYSSAFCFPNPYTCPYDRYFVEIVYAATAARPR